MTCTKQISSITFIKNQPASLGHVCLCDFVKWYRRVDNDVEGRRQYVRAGKPKLPNHRIYDPNKLDEQEAYFYSLLLLFVPFTDESELVRDGQSAEEAFNEHFRDHSSMEHHESLQKILQSQSKMQRINEVRKEEEVLADEDEAVEKEGVKLIGAMHDVHDMDYDTIGLSERISMLNEGYLNKFLTTWSTNVGMKLMVANVKISSHSMCLSVELVELESLL